MALVQGLRAVVWRYDPQIRRFTFVSDYADEMFGAPGVWTDAASWAQSIHPDDRDAAVAHTRQAIRAGENHSLEYRIVHPDGRTVWVRDMAQVTRGADGEVLAIQGVAIDVTAAKLVEQQLTQLAAEQEAQAAVATAVAQNRPPDEVFSVVANAAAHALGVEIGVVWEFREDRVVIKGMHGLQTRRIGHGFPTRPDGPFRRVRLTGRAQRFDLTELVGADEIGQVVRTENITAAVFVPVIAGGATWGCLVAATRRGEMPPDSELRLERMARAAATGVSHAAARARLVEQATTDALTGLANHRAFQERLRIEIARAHRYRRPLTVVLIDLDGFKLVNDSHGHAVGDRALAVVAERLQALARPGDVLARIGGDEFAWILPETDALGGYSAAERARAAIALEEVLPGVELDSSAGVCGLEEAEEPDDLMRLVDGALYWAKAHGRGVTYRYSPAVVRELSAAERAERLARQRTLGGLSALARAVDAKDHSTREHSERVADLAELLGSELGLGEETVLALREAGLLHDVGKIGVPDAVLSKPGRLTADEFELVKAHAALGAKIASEVLDDRQVSWIRGHHERWDGRGYPDGLSGESIPIGARILSLADAWDVMLNVRSYKSALEPAVAVEECRRCAGSQFSAEVVAALERLWSRGALSPAAGALGEGARL